MNASDLSSLFDAVSRYEKSRSSVEYEGRELERHVTRCLAQCSTVEECDELTKALPVTGKHVVRVRKSISRWRYLLAHHKGFRPTIAESARQFTIEGEANP